MEKGTAGAGERMQKSLERMADMLLKINDKSRTSMERPMAHYSQVKIAGDEFTHGMSIRPARLRWSQTPNERGAAKEKAYLRQVRKLQLSKETWGTALARRPDVNT